MSVKIVVAFLVRQTCPRLGWIDLDNGAEAPRDVKAPNGLGRVKGSRAERAGSAALDPACARWGRASRARGGRRLRRELRTPAGSLDEGVAAAPWPPEACSSGDSSIDSTSCTRQPTTLRLNKSTIRYK